MCSRATSIFCYSLGSRSFEHRGLVKRSAQWVPIWGSSAIRPESPYRIQFSARKRSSCLVVARGLVPATGLSRSSRSRVAGWWVLWRRSRRCPFRDKLLSALFGSAFGPVHFELSVGGCGVCPLWHAESCAPSRSRDHRPSILVVVSSPTQTVFRDSDRLRKGSIALAADPQAVQ